MMDLFEGSHEQPRNLLHRDGCVQYYNDFLSHEQASYYFSALMTDIEWKSDQAHIMGKIITTKRQVAWYGDLPYAYRYSGTTKVALPWNPYKVIREHNGSSVSKARKPVEAPMPSHVGRCPGTPHLSFRMTWNRRSRPTGK